MSNQQQPPQVVAPAATPPVLTPEEIAAKEKTLEEAKHKVLLSKTALLNNPQFTFYSSLLVRFKLVWRDEIKTAATNGRVLMFNPAFIASLDQRVVLFVLLHEVQHVIYKHMYRVNGRDPKCWNRACDYMINNELDKLGFKVWENALLDHQYDGMTADEIYYKLFQDIIDNPNAPREDPDHDDLMPPMPGDDEALNEEIDKMLISATLQAQAAGQQAAGNIPAYLQRAYEKLTNPVVPWQTILSRFLFGVAANDYSMRRPKRRYAAHDLYLPSMHGQGLEQLDFAIDTSGSVSTALFERLIGEVANIFKTFNPQRIGIMQFDHELKSRNVISDISEFDKIIFQGGGGTDILPVLEEFASNEAKALIMLTDGYFTHDKSWDPGKPVIWLIYDNEDFNPPFGEAVHFESEHLMA